VRQNPRRVTRWHGLHVQVIESKTNGAPSTIPQVAG
jgi:hypothetical protein